MIMRITARKDHWSKAGTLVAYVHFTREAMTYLIEERPWHSYPVAVVYMRSDQ